MAVIGYQHPVRESHMRLAQGYWGVRLSVYPDNMEVFEYQGNSKEGKRLESFSGCERQVA